MANNEQMTFEDMNELHNQQDEKLNTLYGTITIVKQKATDINREILSHAPILDKFGDKVDTTGNNLGQKNKQLSVIIETETKCCGMWPYYGVIIILIFIALIIIASWF